MCITTVCLHVTSCLYLPASELAHTSKCLLCLAHDSGRSDCPRVFVAVSVVISLYTASLQVVRWLDLEGLAFGSLNLHICLLAVVIR